MDFILESFQQAAWKKLLFIEFIFFGFTSRFFPLPGLMIASDVGELPISPYS